MRNSIFIVIVLVLLIFACTTGKNGSNEKSAQHIRIGNGIVKKTFDTLRSSLQSSISQSGFEGAVQYCQTAAFQLTNTYSSDSVFIRRTSLKYRNSENKPTPAEENILKTFASQVAQGIVSDSIKPVTEEEKNGLVHYYKPILVQNLCVSCHGTRSKDITPAVWQTIQSLYPGDMAYNYKVGDVRGMWHITFKAPRIAGQ